MLAHASRGEVLRDVDVTGFRTGAAVDGTVWNLGSDCIDGDSAATTVTPPHVLVLQASVAHNAGARFPR